MSSYLSQLRKLKLQPSSSAFGVASEAAQRTDNGTVLRNIADLVLQRDADDQVLKAYFKLFTDDFNWLDATEQEIRQCESTVIDLVISDSSILTSVINHLLPQFRDVNPNGSKIDLCGHVFANVQELKKKLRQILLESTPDVNLVGESYELVLGVLKSHPWHKDSITDIDGLFTSIHMDPRYRNLRCFFYRKRDGSCVDFSYTRCADYVRRRSARYIESIRNVIVELCRMFPCVVGIVADSIESIYPHYNIAIEQHTSVTKSLLYLARHVSALRPVVYRLLFKKMTIIDAEIRCADPLTIDAEKMDALRSEGLKEIASKLHRGEIDISEAKDLVGNPDWIKQMYDNCNTEEDMDIMTQKLDNLMAIMFEELESVITCNINTPSRSVACKWAQSSTDHDEHEHASSDSGTDSDEDSSCDGSYNDVNHAYGIKREDEIHDAQTLRRAISVPCNRGSVPYGLRRVKSEIPKDAEVVTVSDLIISMLFDIFEDIILPTLKCKYVQFLYMHIISFKKSWIQLFLQRMLLILYDEEAHSMRRKWAASYIASMVCRASYIKGPLVCSIVYYLFSMLGKFDFLLTHAPDSATSSVASDITPRSRNRYGESPTMQSGNRLSRFYSLLQDLLHIVGYHAAILGASPRCVSYLQECENSVCAYIACHLQPLCRLQRNIVEDAIKATAVVPSLSKLHMCLVDAKQAMLAADPISQQVSLLISLDSWYPFDTFPLYHSNYFIRDKYRYKTYYEEYLSSDTTCIKVEPMDESAMKRGDILQEQHSYVKSEFYPNYGSPAQHFESNPVIGANTDFHSGIQTHEKASSDMHHIRNDEYDVNCDVKREVDISNIDSSANTNSVYSLQAITIKDCPPIHEESEVSHERRMPVDSGRWSLKNVIREKIHEKQRRMVSTRNTDIESDYDFWGIDYAIGEPYMDRSEDAFTRSGSFKRIKREDDASDSNTSEASRVPMWDTAAKRYESSDNTNLIVIGIDQLDDFELSLSGSILVNAPRRGASRLLDTLTSTPAYKSAIINSEATKSRHKRS